MSKESRLLNYLDQMWKDYCALNPQAQAVFQSLNNLGEQVVNDHIAFRTFSHPQIDIDKLAVHFLNFGYKEVANYEFVEKKLRAKHFEHPVETMPKVFISALDLSKCSNLVRQTVSELVKSVSPDSLSRENFLYAGRPWSASYKVYQELSAESEYAAWVYAHGYRPNHFTVYINHLKKLNDIRDLNAFLRGKGFILNSSGGEIKGSPADFLEQSSTMANVIPVQFSEGEFTIPGCYYEFAKRYPLKNGKLFQGFVAQSADKIFESTHRAGK